VIFKEKVWRMAQMAQKCLFLWIGPKEDKKGGEEASLGWLYGEWIGVWGSVLAQSKDTAYLRNRGTS
jgi:hypothetical protein